MKMEAIRSSETLVNFLPYNMASHCRLSASQEGLSALELATEEEEPFIQKAVQKID
jgi:hypothetical protein